jgi:hypothetical protein
MGISEDERGGKKEYLQKKWPKIILDLMKDMNIHIQEAK